MKDKMSFLKWLWSGFVNRMSWLRKQPRENLEGIVGVVLLVIAPFTLVFTAIVGWNAIALFICFLLTSIILILHAFYLEDVGDC